MKIRFDFLSIVLLALVSTFLSAQTETSSPTTSSPELSEQKPFLLGVAGSIVLALPSGSFRGTCDCEFQSGKGSGFMGALVAQYDITRSFGVELSAGYSEISVLYTTNDLRMKFGESGQKVSIDYEQRAELGLDYFNVTLATYWCVRPISLRVSIGPTFDLILSSQYKQTETIKTPGYIAAGSTTNNKILYSGALDHVYTSPSLLIGLHAGLSYDFSVTQGMNLQPGILYIYPITSFASEYASWKVGELGAVLLFSIVM